MNTEKMYAAKSKLSCMRIRNRQDIERLPAPNGVVTAEENGFAFQNAEIGNCFSEYGVVVGYEKLDLDGALEADRERLSRNCPFGYNVWVKANAEEHLAAGIIRERADGTFDSVKVSPRRIEPITEEFPKMLEGLNGSENISRTETGWSLQTEWGVSQCSVGGGYWILYGIKPDGTMDANILTRGTESFNNYSLCSEDGTIIRPLSEV